MVLNSFWGFAAEARVVKGKPANMWLWALQTEVGGWLRVVKREEGLSLVPEKVQSLNDVPWWQLE